MDYTVVDARPELLDGVEAIERQCFSLPWTKKQLEGQLKNSQHEFLAAVSEDGTVLGYVGMTYVLDEGYISNVAVAEPFRRLGIGDRLIDALLSRAEGLALAFVSLEVRESNTPAKELYAKHGFVPVGLRKNYYEKPRENALLMTKFLKEMNVN